MPQVFRPRANAIARLVLLAAAAGSLVLLGGGVLALRSDAYTGVGLPRAQPVPFSHEHHVGGLGLDCRYCHTAVETAPSAGLPATEVCMTCHAQLWTSAPVLAPVRRSFLEGVPIRWNRVNDVGDFVYFNHAIHVNKGVACATCHGRVDRMPLMARANPMQMSWCLGCHRDPGPHIGPHSAVFDPEAVAPARPAVDPHMRSDAYRLTDCYVCHR